MSKKPNLGQLNQVSVSQINTAFAKIDQSFENTLSRDGSTPNNMSADLDMNSNDIINVGNVSSQSITVESATIGGKVFNGTLEWRSDWTEDTLYRYLDLVKYLGSVYVCVIEHTSDVFNNEVAELKWELFLEPGTSGGGVTDHGLLTGLADDDHTQYHNNVRGDARYYTKSEVDTSLGGKANTSHTHVIADTTGLQTVLDGKQAVGSYAASSHTHVKADVTDFAHSVTGAEHTFPGGTTTFLRADGTFATPAGGSGTSGDITITVPNNRREHQETVTATGVTGANRISIWLAPGLDSDENISDMIDLVTLSAIPLTDQITILASFSQPQAGPIKLQWSAF